MSFTKWNETEALPEASAWLLEASAGTGKTYQIAGLVLRLVAEYGLPVERILTITFTNAATAELRDRIRRRLASALVELERETPSTSDPYVQYLAGLKSPSREEQTGRIRIALRDFDLAAISTIHGFSQRMLTELAFDSGQDPDLELLSEPSEILEEIVDDELARFFHQASPDEVTLYKQAGFTRVELLRVAKVMCGAVTPKVRPEAGPDGEQRTRDAAREFLRELAEVRRHFEGEEADAALSVFRSVFDQFNYANRLPSQLEKTIAWLCHVAQVPHGEEAAIEALRATNLRTARKSSGEKSPSPLEEMPFWTALEALDDFVPTAEKFWSSFAPLADFAANVRGRYEAEVQRRRVLTFDSMLSRLAEKVTTEGGTNSPVAARIRERFDAVLVDEFQDTDSAQWTVLDAAFLGHRRLILIGDPKQAIYAFRGADVHVYAKAAEKVDAARRRTMKTNFRSDKKAIRAMNTLWRADSRAFDVDEFDYVNVDAANKESDVRDEAWDAPGLDIRWLDNRLFGGGENKPVESKRTADVARLAAAEVVASLSPYAGAGKLGIQKASDLAVLVNSHRQADAVLRALRDVKVPAVAASRATVFATDVATWIAAWLDAVAAGGRDREARAAVVTPLFGWTADDLAWALAIALRGQDARDEEHKSGRSIPEGRGLHPWETWTTRLHDAASKWPKWGFARVFDREVLELGVFPRLLAMPGGERHATDLRHLFELIHTHERATRSGPAALATWMREEAEVEDQERAQRLESDAEAVRIETIHASKGLQYGHVMLPFGWDARAAQKSRKGPIVIRGKDGVRVDLSALSSGDREEAITREREETRREDLRKLYVALTRAKHRNVVWYGPMGKNGHTADATALGRLLLRDPDPRVQGFQDETLPSFKTSSESKPKSKPKPDSAPAPDSIEPQAPSTDPWTLAYGRLDALVERSEGATQWSAVAELPEIVPWNPPRPEAPLTPTAAKPIDRTSLRGRWMVASYSGLATRSEIGASDGAGREARAQLGSGDAETEIDVDNTTTASELEGDETRAGRDERSIVPAPASKPTLLTVAMAEGDVVRLQRGRGTDFGSFVHEVFEHLDFTRGEGADGTPLELVVATRAARYGQNRDPNVPKEVTAAMPKLLATPLDAQGGAGSDPLWGLPRELTLSNIDQKDRLDELEFNLRLGAGVKYERHAGASPGSRPGCVDSRRIQSALEAALDATDSSRAAIDPVRTWVEHHLGRAKKDGKQLVAEIAGILTGSIDLVFRTKADGERFFIVDYKTNMIETSTLGHFTGPWLAWKMATTGYPLQALIYTVALHRHLGVRMGSRYDYDRHVGGYLYLFVRGMVGAETPRCPTTGRCLGVFAHRWTKQTIELMDEALGAEVLG